MRISTPFIITFVFLLLLYSGCTKEHPDQPIANKSPKTFLWLFPDSTLAEGNSKQRVRWWGEDPDGVIKGFLFASGKNITSNGQLPANDTLTWIWTTKNDSTIAFPLLVRQDTFQIAVRGVDNSFHVTLPEHAVVRFQPSAYWDVNENGVYDSGDISLPTLQGAMDINGATLPLPLLNQPPSIVFAQNPNDPASVMQQPETTFTVASFSWVGSDPDGDQTITNYEIALNDPSDSTRWVRLPGNTKLVSLVVPRSRSDSATSEVSADIYSGTFSSTRHYLGMLGHLQLNSLNTFYVRARDVAGDVSPTIQMPSTFGKWYVKKPTAKLLIVSDYIVSDSSAALSFYMSVLSQVPGGKFTNIDVLNIGRGLSAQQKRNNKLGVLVPPFIDPAFIYTLELYDVVFWFTDQFPSLSVAQFPLFQYVRDQTVRGKVIFSTSFEGSSDPRGALKDFAPIDSVSSVDLNPARLQPVPGDTRVPGGYQLFSDSSDLSDVYPSLKFNTNRVIHSVFLRSIYRRADAKYIYHIQQDTRIPQRYVYTSVLSDLRAVASVDANVWACGANGVILSTSNAGVEWNHQKSGTTFDFNAIKFLDAVTGLVIGDNGTILRTNDGGNTWQNRSVLTFERLLGLDFPTTTNGIVVGTNGLLIHTTNGGSSWTSPSIPTTSNLRSVAFADQNIGVAVGDNGSILKTTDGGTTWQVIPAVTPRHLNAVKFLNGSTALAVGAGGIYIRSTDAGDTWLIQPTFPNIELLSMSIINASIVTVCGPTGTLYQSVNGGINWTSLNSGFTVANGQTLNGITFSAPTTGWSVASGGVIIGTSNGGTNWSPQPNQNLNIGVIDGAGIDGKRSFVFLGLPLHLLNGDGTNVQLLLEKILLEEFGE